MIELSWSGLEWSRGGGGGERKVSKVGDTLPESLFGSIVLEADRKICVCAPCSELFVT